MSIENDGSFIIVATDFFERNIKSNSTLPLYQNIFQMNQIFECKNKPKIFRKHSWLNLFSNVSDEKLNWKNYICDK